MRRLVVGLAIISLAALALSWAQADDQEIAKEITERLKQEQKVGHLRDFDINLKVADGNVLLKGRVTSREQQKLALETARGAKGVKHVVSDLQITPATPTADAAKTAADTPVAEGPTDGSPVSDAQIGEQLSAELKRWKDAGELKGFGLGISVNKGVVVLRGRVSNAEQLQLAMDAAKQTPGVTDVVSHVVVVADVAPQDNVLSSEVAHPVASGKERRDEEISQQIALAVKAQKAAGKLKGFDIDLAVEKGVATYTGQVPTAAQMQLVVDLARQTPGVRDVVNKMVVVPSAPQAKDETAESQAVTAPPAKVADPRDGDIARRIAASLRKQQAAGNLKGFDIDAVVKNGIVTYTGHVANAAQLQTALNVARQTPGVRDVVSQLVLPEASVKTRPADTEAAQAAPAADTEVAQAAPVADTEVAQAAPAPPAVPNDLEIAQQIIASLKQEQDAGNLKGFNIDVAVKDGIVKYTGRVANADQFQTVLAVAQQTDGVRDVLNQMVVAEITPPTPREALPETVAVAVTSASYRSERSDAPAMDYAAEDQRIGEELTAGLDEAKRTGHLHGFGINVRVERSHVWLQGRVSSAEQRQLAADIARNVPGASQITNDLSVTAPMPEPVVAQPRYPNRGPEVTRKAPANEIARVLNARLRSEESQGKLRGSNLKIQVVGSQVTLHGQVADPDQRDLAVETAQRVPGVEKVVDSLTERPVSMVVPTAYPYTYAEYPTAANSNGPVPVPAPRPLGAVQTAAYLGGAVVAAPFMAISQATEGSPIPAHMPSPGAAQVPARYDHPYLPGYAWPSYAAYPNYAAVTYPKQYSPTAWPYIGPFYPYPQVPLGWRKVTLKWDDGWWQLNFKSK